MVFLLYNACPAVHQTLTSFKSVSSSMPVKKTVHWTARLDTRVSSVTHHLVERESRGGCFQKNYIDPFANRLCMAGKQLTRTVC